MRWRKIVKLVTVFFAIMIAAAACAFVAVQEGPSTNTLQTVSRADTRLFVGMRYEREIDIAYLWTFSQAALPNEIAFCLYGHAVDTTMTFTRFSDGENVEMIRQIAVIDSVSKANIEIATPTYVQFTEGVACDPNPRLIGTAHTHPNIPHPQLGGRCTHSDLDVLYAQNRETEYWFTLVLCTWTHELLWADGRRLEYYVRNPSDPFDPESQSPMTDNQL